MKRHEGPRPGGSITDQELVQRAQTALPELNWSLLHHRKAKGTRGRGGDHVLFAHWANGELWFSNWSGDSTHNQWSLRKAKAYLDAGDKLEP